MLYEKINRYIPIGSILILWSFGLVFAADGDVDLAFDAGEFRIYGGTYIETSFAQNDGKILIGGQFTKIGEVNRNYIARLNPDGAVDLSFDPNTNDLVEAIVQQDDGKILVGGRFTSIGGINRNHIARLNTDGSLDQSFNPNLNIDVKTITVQPDGRILVGGSDAFSPPGTTPFLRLDTGGNLDTTFNFNSRGVVESSALQSDGKILVGGRFLGADFSQLIRYLARLNPDGSYDTSFNTVADRNVNIINIQSNGKILIGGQFTHVDGISRNGAARLLEDGSVDISFDAQIEPIGVLPAEIYSLTVQPDGRILIGGRFETVGGVLRRYIAMTNADGSLDTNFMPNPNTSVRSIVIQNGGQIFIAGAFTRIGNEKHGNIARLNEDGSSDISFTTAELLNLEVGGVASVVSIQQNGKILVGGSFNAIAGVGRNQIARLNVDGSLDTGFDPDSSGWVRSIVEQADSKILVSGNFSNIGGVMRNNIARLNSDGSVDAGFDPNVNTGLRSIAVQTNGKILIGGSFTNVGGVSRNYIARLNPDGTLDNEFQPELDNSVNSILVLPDDKILVGGEFNSVDGESHNHIVRLNVDGSLDNSFNVSANFRVRTTFVQHDGKILIGGDFTTVNGEAREILARLNEGGSLDITFNPEIESTSYKYIESINLQPDGKVIVVGRFASVTGVSRNNIARLNIDGSLDLAFNVNPNPRSGIVAVAIQNDGKTLIGGSFNDIDGVKRGVIARLEYTQQPEISFVIVPIDAERKEGDIGSSNIRYAALGTLNALGSSSVNYTVTGTGVSPADEFDFGGVFPSGSIVFNEGETSKIISIPVIGDTTFEADETFTITLSDPVNATIATNMALGRIINDDLDIDTDNDGIGDSVDNCPTIANPNQVNSDDDLLGDVCDNDDDNDNWDDDVDNCPLISNPGQENNDNDSIGDTCDLDDDNDTIADDEDNCQLNANVEQIDTDGDLFGDACDTDDDEDGIPDATDNCPLIDNADQEDKNRNGIGDVCEPEGDGGLCVPIRASNENVVLVCL